MPHRWSVQVSAAWALVMVQSAIGMAQPSEVGIQPFFFRGLGVSPSGNRVWEMFFDPSRNSTTGAVAIEVGLRVNNAGVNFEQVNLNSDVWTYLNPGRQIFNWETLTDLDPSSTVTNQKPVGFQVGGPIKALSAHASASPTDSDINSGVSALAPAGVPGDYNNNGQVDAADFVVWRNHLGTAFPLPNEVSTLGVVTTEDYNAWKARYDRTSGAGAALFLEDSSAQSSFVSPGSEIFAALGTTSIGSGNFVPIVQFETTGTGPTTVEVLGRYGTGASNARWSQTNASGLVDTYDNISFKWVLGDPGDLNFDGNVNHLDIDFLARIAHTRPNDEFYDLNGDRVVTYSIGPPGSPTPSDSDVLIRDILGTEYGDLNLDGTVFLGDLNTFATNYRQAGQFGWAEGNINGSQEPGTAANPQVFLADLNALATNWRFGVGAGAAFEGIPEPGGWMLAMCGVFAGLCCRTRGRREYL